MEPGDPGPGPGEPQRVGFSRPRSKALWDVRLARHRGATYLAVCGGCWLYVFLLRPGAGMECVIRLCARPRARTRGARAATGRRQPMDEIYTVAFLRDEGRLYLLAAGEYGLIYVVDVDARRQRPPLYGHGAAVWEIRPVPGLPFLFVSCSDQPENAIRVWSVRSGRQLAVFAGDTHSQGIIGIALALLPGAHAPGDVFDALEPVDGGLALPRAALRPYYWYDLHILSTGHDSTVRHWTVALRDLLAVSAVDPSLAPHAAVLTFRARRVFHLNACASCLGILHRDVWAPGAAGLHLTRGPCPVPLGPGDSYILEREDDAVYWPPGELFVREEDGSLSPACQAGPGAPGAPDTLPPCIVIPTAPRSVHFFSYSEYEGVYFFDIMAKGTACLRFLGALADMEPMFWFKPGILFTRAGVDVVVGDGTGNAVFLRLEGAAGDENGDGGNADAAGDAQGGAQAPSQLALQPVSQPALQPALQPAPQSAPQPAPQPTPQPALQAAPPTAPPATPSVAPPAGHTAGENADKGVARVSEGLGRPKGSHRGRKPRGPRAAQGNPIPVATAVPSATRTLSNPSDSQEPSDCFDFDPGPCPAPGLRRLRKYVSMHQHLHGDAQNRYPPGQWPPGDSPAPAGSAESPDPRDAKATPVASFSPSMRRRGGPAAGLLGLADADSDEASRSSSPHSPPRIQVSGPVYLSLPSPSSPDSPQAAQEEGGEQRDPGEPEGGLLEQEPLPGFQGIETAQSPGGAGEPGNAEGPGVAGEAEEAGDCVILESADAPSPDAAPLDPAAAFLRSLRIPGRTVRRVDATTARVCLGVLSQGSAPVFDEYVRAADMSRSHIAAIRTHPSDTRVSEVLVWDRGDALAHLQRRATFYRPLSREKAPPLPGQKGADKIRRVDGELYCKVKRDVFLDVPVEKAVTDWKPGRAQDAFIRGVSREAWGPTVYRIPYEEVELSAWSESESVESEETD